MNVRKTTPKKTATLGAALASCLVLATPGQALDQLVFSTPGASDTLRTALERSSLLTRAEADGITDPLEVFSIARVEYGRLIGTLYEAGHYSGVINVLIDGREAADISPLDPPAQIGTIEVRVNPGPKFVFGRARIGPLAPNTTARDDFAPGAPARSTVIRDAARGAVDDWRDRGHAKAEPADQDVIADHDTRQLDADVTIDPGPRLRFGELRPTGQRHVRPERIVAIAGLPTGERFSPEAATRAATRLRRTGAFASVALREAEDPNPDSTLDFDVSVVEAPRRRIGAGAEYDTEDGVRLTAFWMHRNLLGGAERFRVEGEVAGIGARSGGVDFRLGTEFTRPATFTPDTALTLGAMLESEDQRDYTARRARISAGVTHLFSDTLTGDAAIEYQFERARFGADRSVRRNFSTVALPLGLTWDRRNDTLDPTRGFYLAGTATPFLGLRDADTGAQTTLDARGFYPFGGEDRIVFAARAQLGAVLGADISATPRRYLFYSGGGGTVRGQPFESLGVSPGGVDSGGQGFAAFATEVRVGVTDTIGVVAFADAGFVSEGAFSGASDWHAGAGLGVRYDTAVGPLRVDLGMPVRGDTGRGLQIYIGIGQAF
ncbi:outer membrane protein assembly factor [Rhodobacteraceae bacterium 2376]|uniref:Outer membrane protein assembly factor n=1 Tax=Rhabdonatronobacter sediminivivens TaxID=2743469 RepID=A0A7Z0KX88_9RHOB|nr:outer membrane protein assembly factor [Rhabdonatronobacter sediminivivens]